MTIDVEGIDVTGDEAILKDDDAEGYVSSGAYSNPEQKSMAMGYDSTEFSKPGSALDVEILGQMYRAEVQGVAVYDANGANLRA